MARAKRTEKKRWFPIIAPKIFYNQVVGEILLTNPSNAVGRTIPVNLANLAKDPRRQNITIKLIASNVAGEKIHTEPIGYEISPAFIKKMVRKGGTKVDYAFAAETADNKKIIVKTVLLTRKTTKISVATALRKMVEDTLKREMKKSSFVELMQAIVAHKMQSNLKRQLAKVYPLKMFEIRHISIEKGKKPIEEKPVTVKKEKETPKKEPKEEKEEKTSEKEAEEKEEEKTSEKEAEKTEEKKEVEEEAEKKPEPKEEKTSEKEAEKTE